MFLSRNSLTLDLFDIIIVAHAAYFSVYEGMKVAVGADQHGHHPALAALCGSSAALSHDLFMTPMDTVKQRMQLGYYKNVFHCLRTILRTEGLRSLYVSFPTTVLMNLPYGGIMLATNESMKKILNPSEEYSIMASMISGSVAGLVAAACTNPLDVIKTRLQTGSLGSCPVEVPTMTPTIIPVGTTPSAPPSSTHTVPVSAASSSAAKTSSHGGAALGGTTQKKFYSQPISLETPVVHKVSQGANYSAAASSGSNSSNSSTSGVTGRSNTPKSSLMALLKETKNVASSIVKQEGYAGFWRGVGPRMIVHAPSVAVSWTVYEGLKDVLST